MNVKTNAPISRRAFFRIAATLAGSVVATGTGLAQLSSHPVDEASPSLTVRLNPAFRIKNIAGDRVELFTHLPDGHVLTHHFTGFDAGLLRQIEHGTSVAELQSALSQLYGLSPAACATKLKKRLRELEKGKLVYYGDKMIVKISETIGGH